MTNVAVLLSGSGFMDGAEINEAVLTLLHVTKQGASYQCFAPDIAQMHVVDHASGEATEESRNVLTESARIARGEVQPLSALNVDDFDALLLPGGFGVAKNFCDFAVKGADMTANADVVAIGKAFAAAGKPAGYICIAPVLTPHVYGAGVHGTLGTDADMAQAFEAMGGTHVNCNVDDIVVDEAHRLVTTPAYMLAENLVQAEQGISKLVEKVVNWSA